MDEILVASKRGKVVEYPRDTHRRYEMAFGRSFVDQYGRPSRHVHDPHNEAPRRQGGQNTALVLSSRVVLYRKLDVEDIVWKATVSICGRSSMNIETLHNDVRVDADIWCRHLKMCKNSVRHAQCSVGLTVVKVKFAQILPVKS